MENIRIFAAANRKFTCNRGVVQLASILAWGASGRPFESGHSDKRAADFSAALFVWMPPQKAIKKGHPEGCPFSLENFDKQINTPTSSVQSRTFRS